MTTEVVTLTNLVEKLNLVIKQGAKFGPNRLTFSEDVSTWTFRGQARKTADSPTVAATITTVPVAGNPLAVDWFFSATATAGMTCHPTDLQHADSTYQWDYEVEKPDGTVLSIHDGQINVWREVTRP
jgi:hypothetical protein